MSLCERAACSLSSWSDITSHWSGTCRNSRVCGTLFAVQGSMMQVVPLPFHHSKVSCQNVEDAGVACACAHSWLVQPGQGTKSQISASSACMRVDAGCSVNTCAQHHRVFPSTGHSLFQMVRLLLLWVSKSCVSSQYHMFLDCQLCCD